MTKGKDVGGAKMSSGVLDALLRAMTVADAAQREAMIKAVHVDGRKWKNATGLTGQPAPR